MNVAFVSILAAATILSPRTRSAAIQLTGTDRRRDRRTCLIMTGSTRRSKIMKGFVRLGAMFATGALCCSMATTPSHAGAPSYPDRPIKLIVSTTAGSLPDILARLVAERLSASLGQPVIVENRPGGAGSIGLSGVAKAAPNGYTLGMISTPFVAAASLIVPMSYDIDNDLAPVALIAWNYVILAIRSDLPVHSVAEFVALGKSKPGFLKYASAGNATPGHLGMKLFERQAGIELIHIPYKGQPPATTALVRGEVDACMAGMSTLEPYVKSGAVRLLATLAPRRLAANPELPTMIELGYPDVDLTDWQGLVAPAGTPVEVIERLSKEVADIVARPEVKDRLLGFSTEPAGLGPVEFKRLIQSERRKLDKLVHEANVRVE